MRFFHWHAIVFDSMVLFFPWIDFHAEYVFIQYYGIASLKPKLAFSTQNSSEKPKLAYSSSNAAAMSDNMRRFADGLRGQNSRLEVFHMVLDGSAWDVWGFNLKHYDDFYWAWKPNILEKAMITEGRIRLFEAEDTFLDDMLHNIRAAPIRETPRGPNVAAAYVYKQGKKIDREILFGLIPSPSSEESVKQIVKEILNHFDNPKVCRAYGVALENSINSANMIADAGESGGLWEKLQAAGRNMTYKRLGSLNEVFLDVKIEEIIRQMYHLTGGEGPSMWPSKLNNLAFGIKEEPA